MSAPTRPPDPGYRRSRGNLVAAIALVAATYIYFLLFAQFGFLQGIRATALAPSAITIVLATMAVAGVAASLSAPRMIEGFGRGGAMSLGLLLCAGAASSSGFVFISKVDGLRHLVIAAVGIGGGLGWMTVGLAADLRRLTAGRDTGLCVGVGTGIAYFVCNIPALYGALPTTKAWFVAIVAAAVVVAVGASRGPRGVVEAADAGLVPARWRSSHGLALATTGFFALVWFDSAAFAALQLAPETHDRLWGGDGARWTNGSVHAVAAIVAGGLLDRGHLRAMLGAAFLLLVAGALGFGAAGVIGGFAAPVYIAGVSFYSTALAAFAALAPAEAGRNSPPWRAAWIYAIAGWIGSAAGVGLAEQFGHLPPWAAPAAAVVMGGALFLGKAAR